MSAGSGIELAVEVEGVSKKFRVYRERNQSLKATVLRGRRAQHEEFWALRDVSFHIPVGSTFGLIGANGSGKSTMLKCIARILRPDSGTIRTSGKIAALLELGSGFHPELSGRENVYLNGSILGLSKRELDARFADIVDFSGVGEFIDQPVKNYSSGMYVRLGFSIAINVDPDILLVDEVLAVGDVAFQEKCTEKFYDFRRAGKTVVVVSHAMGSLRDLCDHAAWLEHGRVVSSGPARELVDEYVDDTRVVGLRAAEHDSDEGAASDAKIATVSVLDADGRAKDGFPVGSTMTILLEWKAEAELEEPVFGVSIEAADGTVLWGQNSRDAGVAVDVRPGSGKLFVNVDGIRLLPGAYRVNTSLVDGATGHTHDRIRDAARFAVGHGREVPSIGVVDQPVEWTVL